MVEVGYRTVNINVEETAQLRTVQYSTRQYKGTGQFSDLIRLKRCIQMRYYRIRTAGPKSGGAGNDCLNLNFRQNFP